MERTLTPDDIEQIARKHNDRYLLPRFRVIDHGGAWGACEKLVNSGRARWIDYSSTFHPGIDLTEPAARDHSQGGEG